DEPRNILDHWPADVSKSRYWTSDGQSEIKRNEAFVRVWRHAIALASRILTHWADPEGSVTEDILDDQAVRQVTGPGFDEAGYDRKLVLLFGNRASLFTGADQGFKQSVLKFALAGIGSLRHSAFHFKGRGGFAQALERGIPMNEPDSPVLAAARELWLEDAAERSSRLLAVMRGTHFEFFLDAAQNRAVFDAITVPTGDGPPMPRFRRMLRRTENALRRSGLTLRLPAPGNRAELEDPARLCQYTVLKLLYERAFPQWLGGRSADALNRFIDRAVERSTKVARKITPDKHAVARAARQGKLQAVETIDHFFDRLSADTATEIRVQRGYEADADKAHKKAKYIDDLRCDVVAQAFEAYLQEKGFDWTLDVAVGKAPPESPISNLDDLPEPEPEAEPEDWLVILYFLIHLVPVDDIARLQHQLRKWTVLEGRPSQNVRAVERLFGLYLDMHDAKFEGGAGLAGANTLRPLFETEALFAQVFPAQEAADLDGERRVPLRGLREMLRFGNLGRLKPIFEAHRISEKDVTALSASESETEGTSPIAAAQARRQALHEKWVESRRRLSDADKTVYREALATVVRHRHLAAQVTLTNHVRLHRLMMQVLGRLLDYAGLWERDLYFVTLALIHLDGTTPPDHFQTDRAKRLLTSGRIVDALRSLTGTPLLDDLEQHFGRGFLDGNAGAAAIRNDLAHFNMLRGAVGDLNLTGLADRTRRLMSYDRKLKNAVSKSIIELLHREGLTLCWRMTGHALADAKLATRQAKHIKDDGTKENLHGAAFVAMAAALFDGVARRCDDVQSLDHGRRDRPKKQRGKRRGGRKKHAKGHRDRPSRGGFSKSER
ncbi:MAG: type VI-A CRISPR-associated RNA-guided ribonuclease Cas13a, partial [Kiloniellales bacterium]|nr:type VI-A CRISPR-associated RNA-guided ribonuclease Cas13a [Kiloniellales bacterium]